ncbi:hypothetical protein F4803DRAFT_540510 [Xylaria telfairii]|nr:hypothetical protein F4803DRAFT_540510 [Xylaria telfairii]
MLFDFLLRNKHSLTMNQFTVRLQNPDRVVTVLFREATPEQVIPCRKLAGAEFRKPLAIDSYLKQEEYLDQKPLVRDRGWRMWCLSLADHPAEVLASCRTIPREVLIRDVSGTSRRNAYCIAAVVTNSQYRNQGFASRLLEFVSQWLDGPGDAAASILYTSIGDFYDRRGWKKIPARQASLSWPVDFSPARNRDQLSATDLLSSLQIPELCDLDVSDVESRINDLVPQPGESHVCVLPTANLITWLQDRSDFVGTELNGAPPRNNGSICEAADSWMYWFHDFRKEQLAVQRIRVPGETSRVHSSALAAMLLDAIQEAREWHLSKVVLWEPDAILLDAISLLQESFDVKAEIGPRLNSSIPSLRWRHADETKTTTFHSNEFYTWS